MSSMAESATAAPTAPETAPIITPASVEAENDEYVADSVFGDNVASSTASVASSIFKYRQENGRTYHAYKDGAYPAPNDEIEQDRLDFQHHLLQLTFNGKLFTAVFPEGKAIHRVLDVGTGTGIWAIDFADAHPESSVIGVDLSPIQPSFTPPNCQFQIDDLEQPWTFTEKFDFIYSRMMMGSFDNIPKFFNQALANLSPGGILEMADVTWPTLLNDGQWPEDCALVKWSTLVEEGFQKFGRRLDCARHYKEQMIAAGFDNVVQTNYIWPGNTWPKDKKLKEIGLWECENLMSGLEAISVGVFTRALGWEKLEVDVLLAQVRADIKNTKIHAYKEFIVVTGQKPE